MSRKTSAKKIREINKPQYCVGCDGEIRDKISRAYSDIKTRTTYFSGNISFVEEADTYLGPIHFTGDLRRESCESKYHLKLIRRELKERSKQPSYRGKQQ